MSDDANTAAAAGSGDAASSALQSAGSNSDALIGMAALGKTAAALALVVAIILICAALLKRWGNRHVRQGARLQVVGSTAVGNRERVVVVEIEGTWLVLGVGNGQISKLHEMPAPPEPHRDDSEEPFAQRFAHAIKRQGGTTMFSDSDKSDSSS
ncbi:MAG: flagellar biosynthetic protein FliO [Pseudomonadota bacterium]